MAAGEGKEPYKKVMSHQKGRGERSTRGEQVCRVRGRTGGVRQKERKGQEEPESRGEQKRQKERERERGIQNERWRH